MRVPSPLDQSDAVGTGPATPANDGYRTAPEQAYHREDQVQTILQQSSTPSVALTGRRAGNMLRMPSRISARKIRGIRNDRQPSTGSDSNAPNDTATLSSTGPSTQVGYMWLADSPEKPTESSGAVHAQYMEAELRFVIGIWATLPNDVRGAVSRLLHAMTSAPAPHP